jgi:hypothetical protein
MGRLAASHFVLMLIVGAFSGCLGTGISASPQDSYVTTKYDEDEVLKRLFPLLSESAGRLYYSADCPAQNDESVPFPLTALQPNSKNGRGLRAVRELFKNDANVLITEEPSGIAKVRIGNVSDAVLQTKISLLTLTPTEQYNPSMVFGVINSTQEFKAAKRTMKIRPALRVVSDLLVQPRKGYPHLPSALKNLTVDQLLDLVAKTFGGVVVYGACAQPSLFEVDFVQPIDPVDTENNADNPPE